MPVWLFYLESCVRLGRFAQSLAVYANLRMLVCVALGWVAEPPRSAAERRVQFVMLSLQHRGMGGEAAKGPVPSRLEQTPLAPGAALA